MDDALSRRVCVIGLGYVGLPTAASIAAQGVEVVGVDVDAERRSAIGLSTAPTAEDDLNELVRAVVAAGTLRTSATPVPADAFIITVPTPHRSDHAPDVSFVRAAAESLAPLLRRRNLVVLESTSPVGTTEKLCAWLAERRRDLSFPHTAGEKSDVRVAYSPERAIPGSMLQELTNNDRIIGGMTGACAAAATRLYRLFVFGQCHTTTVRTAELVKLAENAYRDVNIGFANEISLVCDSLGVDPWKVIELANRHPRVDILKPGPGVGGHCIAVDPWFIVHSAPDRTPLIQAARQVNSGKPLWVAAQVLAACKELEQPTIACLGLAYKADIGDLRESPAIAVIKRLQETYPGQLLVVEPYIEELPPGLAGDGRTELVCLDQALSADVILLLTDHKELRCVDPRRLAGKRIIDTRGVWRDRCTAP